MAQFIWPQSDELRSGLRRMAAIGLAIFFWPLAIIGIVLAINPGFTDIVLVFALPFFGSWIIGAVICMLVLVRSIFEIRIIRREGREGSVRHRLQAIALSSCPVIMIGLSAWLVYGQHWV